MSEVCVTIPGFSGVPHEHFDWMRERGIDWVKRVKSVRRSAYLFASQSGGPEFYFPDENTALEFMLTFGRVVK